MHRGRHPYEASGSPLQLHYVPLPNQIRVTFFPFFQDHSQAQPANGGHCRKCPMRLICWRLSLMATRIFSIATPSERHRCGAHGGPGQLPCNTHSMKRSSSTADGFSSEQSNLLLPQHCTASRWRRSVDLRRGIISVLHPHCRSAGAGLPQSSDSSDRCLPLKPLSDPTRVCPVVAVSVSFSSMVPCTPRHGLPAKSMATRR